MRGRSNRQGIGETWAQRVMRDFGLGFGILVAAVALVASASFNAGDPSLNVAAAGDPANWLGRPGATLADLLVQAVGLVSIPAAMACIAFFTAHLVRGPGGFEHPARRAWLAVAALVMLCIALSALPRAPNWPMASGFGGLLGDALLALLSMPFAGAPGGRLIVGVLAALATVACTILALRLTRADLDSAIDTLLYGWAGFRVWVDEMRVRFGRAPAPAPAATRRRRLPVEAAEDDPDGTAGIAARFAPAREPRVHAPAVDAPPWDEMGDIPVDLPRPRKESARAQREAQPELPILPRSAFELPRLDLLARPKARTAQHDESALKQNARLLMSVLNDFGVRGEIVHVRPGPVVTLYELEPAAGVKSSRVIGLADDIARSMSAIACRVAVVPGRNAIGIELPNTRRETVYLRSLLSAPDYESARHELPLALGETIGGEPSVANLAKMPHLLIAGTTGSGKSVGINAMILSLLYKLSPEQCRFIMIDPKMLELSVYDGIPHLLAPVVTDPKKAVAALKWTVREMETRYERMSKIGVRNIAGYNQRAREAQARGETFNRTIQTGWDRDTGKPVYETHTLELNPLPFIVVVIDEMADLMLVAGKDIEGAVQRLAQMARAAGIHLIMATQRPSVDVITGTIKANFPTRISYAVTSKIDSRTILGEQGAEQLLGQGDLLFMAGGGRIQRLHGPYVGDNEVEDVVAMLKAQGHPEYFEDITAEADEDGGDPDGDGGYGGSGDDLFDKAVAIVARDRKASTSYLQRCLKLGYNRAADLIERMEREGMITPPNHAGKREILLPAHGER